MDTPTHYKAPNTGQTAYGLDTADEAHDFTGTTYLTTCKGCLDDFEVRGIKTPISDTRLTGDPFRQEFTEQLAVLWDVIKKHIPEQQHEFRHLALRIDDLDTTAERAAVNLDTI